jgi:hypothetical protein
MYLSSRENLLDGARNLGSDTVSLDECDSVVSLQFTIVLMFVAEAWRGVRGGVLTLEFLVPRNLATGWSVLEVA